MPDTLLLQSSNSFYRIILQLIFHNNHTCINTVAGTQYQAFRHFMQSFRISYSILVHQPIVACQYLFATDVCFQSVPGNLRHRPYRIKGCLLLFAYSTTAFAIGWLLLLSADAIYFRTSASEYIPAVSIRQTRKLPVVSVPVLSKTNVSAFVTASK